VIAASLRESITDAAPTAKGDATINGGWKLTLNQAQLTFSGSAATALAPWGNRTPDLDVVAHASLILAIPRDRWGYEGRGHSLWFCDAEEKGQYGWFELAFMISPLFGRSTRQDPLALDPGEAAGSALWRGVGQYELAWPFTPLATGDLDEFVDRWAEWFAAAAMGALRHPSSMPERRVQGSWRGG
jgi:serine/threonine-protein kinase